ncbi:MAG: Ig-like domain-containing protein [Nitrospira sp.]
MIPPPNTTANNMGTPWAGITSPGQDSPNELLHYGSLNDGYDDGDPHITTVNGLHYDFQTGGEFVALRDINGMEVQTRQTPVRTAPWVSVNTAIAARVGKHRVTWQPNINGKPDPSGLQLRVDGVLTTVGGAGLDFGGGGRIMKSVTGDRLEVDFPDGTALFVASHWWGSQQQWYLDVHVFHTPATEGIMGDVEPGSWEKSEFAETWRVTKATSLFDYSDGQSTKTFIFPPFPKDKIPPVSPEDLALAERVCGGITNKNLLKDCLFDVAVTGDPIFAKSALVLQMMQHGATATYVTVSRPTSRVREEVLFTATVVRQEPGGPIPTGGVMFIVDGHEVGKPIVLDSHGRARWETDRLVIGHHRISARYIPDKGSEFLHSLSLDERHRVDPGYQRYEP